MHYGCAPIAGLNNRLRGIISLWRFQDTFGRYEPECEFSLNWPITSIVPGKYSDVLLNPMVLNDADTPNQVGWRLQVYQNEISPTWAKVKPYTNQPAIDFEYERIPLVVRDKILPYFDRLQFHPNIITKSMGIKLEPRTIGVHCRNAVDWDKYSRNIDLQEYFNTIDQYFPTEPIYLIAHSEEVVAEFIKRYGSRIQTQPDKDYSSGTPTQLQHAVVDMKVVSKLPSYLGDGYSSYTANIWWLGGCKARVLRLM